MIKSFVLRPATTVMFVLFFALLGFVSFFNLNIERFPSIDFPLVIVNVPYPGASPLEIETQVLKKIEDSVVEISEIKKMESRAFENFGYTLIEFHLTADVNVKSVEVKDKVEAILNEFPDAIEKPIIQKVNPFASPVVDLVLTSKSHSSTELFEYADKKLKNLLARVKGVGEVDLFGGKARQIRVDLHPDVMRSRFISIDQVVAQLRARNLTIPGGNINRSNTSVAVRFEGEFKSVEELSAFPLTTSDGSRFPLGAIANVYDGSEDAETVARFNGEETVSLSVKKISDGNDVEVSRGIEKMLPEIRSLLPGGMTLSVAVDRSHYVTRETSSTIEGILIGILLTVFVLYFFTGNWAITIISAVVIPTSIVSSLFLMDVAGFTINFMTLLAIATSLGTLIANAIVVIEAVLRQMPNSESHVEAAIEGTKDAVIPVMAAGGTNLVVFTPIAFMGGMVGQFMLQFGLTVVFATIFSLIASFSLTPMLCALLIRPEKEGAKKPIVMRASESFIQFLLVEYKKVFSILFRFPKISVIVMLGLFVGAFSVASYIGNEFIPVSDESRIEVVMTLPLGTKVEKTLESAKNVEKMLKTRPEVESVLTILGKDGEQNASVVANLVPVEQRELSDAEIISEISPALAKILDAEIEVKRGDGGGNGNADIMVNFSGPDYDKLMLLTESAKKLFEESGYFRSVASSNKRPKMEAKFYPDSKKIDKYGLDGAIIGQALRASIFGDDTNKFKEEGQEYDIVVQIGDWYKDSIESLSDVFVISKTGLVPITELGEVKVEPSVPHLFRRDRQRVIQLTGYLSKSTAGVVQAELEQKLQTMEMPQGVSYTFVGNSESQAETGREIGKAFGIAIILTYMILAAILNSFVHPLTIATSIITSFSGVFLLLFFMESSINIASMLAIVMLVGLAVNNAILILEEVELLLKEDSKLKIQDALWKGIENKFRAVLMTSIAIVFGTLPQIFSHSEAKASMGIVIVGGVLASIFFTFMLTPQTYYYFEKLRRWFSNLKAKKVQKPESVKNVEAYN